MIQGRLNIQPLGRQGLSPFRLASGYLDAARRPTSFPRDLARQPPRRWETSSPIQDDKKSGHIASSPNESILFFDSKLHLSP